MFQFRKEEWERYDKSKADHLEEAQGGHGECGEEATVVLNNDGGHECFVKLRRTHTIHQEGR